jgi:type I thyroxine 5'-deiodinase
MPINERDEVVFAQPTTMEERVDVAQACSLGLDLDIPTLLDEISNDVDEAYAALPDQLYVIDRDGKIAYRSGPGPMGFSSDEFEAALREQLGLGELAAEPEASGSAAAANADPPADGIAGNWRVVIESPMGKREATLELTLEGGALGGRWSTEMGEAELSGTASGSQLEWSVAMAGPMGQMKLAFNADLAGGALSGEVRFGTMGTGTFTATRD